MAADTTFVSIPVDEYRDLIKVQKEAECLKRVLGEKVKVYGGIKHEELELLCALFGLPELLEAV